MEYRIHKKTGDKISILGLGTSYIADTPEKDAVEALIYAHENGINYADLATAGARTFGYYGTAFASVRKEMFYQVHFGANYETGEYGWTTKLETIKRQIDWMLTELKTDYIDYGFIHCLDAASDWQAYQKHGVRLSARRLCKRKRQRTHGPVPPLRSRRRRNLCHETFFRRTL